MLLALSGCGTAEKNTGEAGLTTEATTEITLTDADSNNSDETEGSTYADAEAGSQSEGDYGYPDSIKSDIEPESWRFAFSNKYFKVPAVFDTQWNDSPASFHKYKTEDGNEYYFTVYGTALWSEEVPSWKDIDHIDYTLDGVPDYMKYDLIKTIDCKPGVDPKKHRSPFTLKETEFNLETEEKVEINGDEYIKWVGTAHAEKYEMDCSVYFACYFFAADYSENDKFETTPGFIAVMTQDCSDTGKQIVKDAADYAVTNSYYDDKK